MIIHRDIEQNSVDWTILRSGKVTASEADALISPLGKVRDSEGVTTYLNQKLCERWTGGAVFSLQGPFDVEQGRILEERAKPAFTIHTGIEIENVAFIETDDHHAGCSPDALIGEVSGCEIKCGKMETAIGYLLAGKLPKIYAAQVQFSMFVTGFQSWHFFSYHRQLPPFHLIVECDDKFQAAIGEALDGFLPELDKAYARLCEINGGPPARRVAPAPERERELIDADDFRV